ncbi:GNAT family N-acetyltransferase [Levilactobacillus bambusae]|nr:GNAT family N-acetyltransferase [Levilactobacillus bambusae]
MKKIDTPRLTLRPLAQSDLEDFFELVSNKRVAKMAGFSAAPSLENAGYVMQRYLNNPLAMGIELKPTRRLIGTIELFERMTNHGIPDQFAWDLGYSLQEATWGHGYMTEAGHVFLAQAVRDTPVEAIYASFLVENERSKHVLEKLGFHYEGEVKHPEFALFAAGQHEIIYKQTRDEFLKRMD